MNQKIALIFFLFFSLLFSSLIAREKGGADLKLSADHLLLKEKENLLLLEGNVKVLYKNYTLTGEKAIFNTRTQEGEITGRVLLSHPQGRVSADKLKILYREKQLFFRRNVRFETEREFFREKEEPPSLTVLTCDELDYNWGEEKGTARGEVRIDSEMRKIQAEEILYQGKTEQVLLKGGKKEKVRIERKPDEFLSAQEILINLKDRSARARGEVEGNLVIFSQKKGKKSEGKELLLPPPELENSSVPSNPPPPGENR